FEAPDFSRSLWRNHLDPRVDFARFPFEGALPRWAAPAVEKQRSEIDAHDPRRTCGDRVVVAPRQFAGPRTGAQCPRLAFCESLDPGDRVRVMGGSSRRIARRLAGGFATS